MLSKGLLALLLAYYLVSLCESKSERCYFDDSSSNQLEKDCTSSEYSTYVECVRKRSKRHTDCMSSCEDGEDCDNAPDCGQCDCNFCSYNDCDANCNSCCAGYTPPCSTRSCCHATCQSSCRTSSCRRGCRSRCHKSINTSSSPTSTAQKSNITNQAKHNITTVINLKTVVNNTNIVDMPIRVNNTNLNNITLESPQPGEINVNMQAPPGQTIIQQQPPMQPIYHQPPAQQQQCCNVISPRQCVPTQQPPFQSCYHTKNKVCGDVCTSAIMHAEPHRVCDQQQIVTQQQQQQQVSNCHEQVAYIPQPQPRCFSTSMWPYVNCMIAKPSCTGCYTHLVNGGQAPSSCPNSCYDQGINVGPSYYPGPMGQIPYEQQFIAGAGAEGGYPRSCGVGGCLPDLSGLIGNGMAVQSLGQTFEQGGSNVGVVGNGIDNNPLNQQQYNNKKKRHSEKEAGVSAENETSESLEYKVEEYPIKMD